MAPRLHVGQEVAACVLTVGVLEAWVEVLIRVKRVKAWSGRGGEGGVLVDRRLGEVRGARYQSECNLISPLLFTIPVRVLSLSVFSQSSFSFLFLKLYHTSSIFGFLCMSVRFA
jgi:hypothetical protein